MHCNMVKLKNEISMSDLYFFNNKKTRYLRFSNSAYQHIVEYAQHCFLLTEAGGELFSTYTASDNVHIEVAAGPHVKDRRKRTSFNQNTVAATQTRNSMLLLNMHPIGLWHTHPEKHPKPSSLDRVTTIKYFESLGEEISQYAMVICGNSRKNPELKVEVVKRKSPTSYQWELYEPEFVRKK